MPVDKIRRGAAPAKVGFPNANSFRVDPTAEEVFFGTGTSGTTEKQLASAGAVVASGSTLTVTRALHNGRTILLSRAGGITLTLPAATGSGNRFRFAVAVALSAANYVIQVANANDYLRGLLISKDDGSATSVIGHGTANTGTPSTESDTITLDGTTKGGGVGDIIELEDIVANIYSVKGLTRSSGTEASPFSAAV